MRDSIARMKDPVEAFLYSKTKRAKESKIYEEIPVKKRYRNQKSEKINIFAGLEEMLDGDVQAKPRSKGRVQLDLAPNAVEFIESPEFLDGPELHVPQYEVVRDFFELLCPRCNDIDRIYDKEDIPRDDQILFRYNTCPKCGLNKLQHADRFRNCNELIGVVGMRGGKSVLIACMSAYILHELLCVENLQEKLGVVKSQEIDAAFVAASGEQASETIYGHFRGFYDNSPWFQAYRKKLLDLEIADPTLRRGDLYWQTEKSIHFREKHIRVKSLTSNSGTIAGKTRIFAVIDELSRMDMGESKRSAGEVYRVLKRSLITIKSAVARLRKKGIYDIPDARMFCISSPMFEDDKSMQLLKLAKRSDKMFAFHRSTWEFNPEITQEDLADEYSLDPVGSERDYGANPPGAENPFVYNTTAIELCISSERTNMFDLREIFFEQKVDQYVFAYVRPEIVQMRWHNLHEYVIHCDPGEKQDSFCLAIGHLEEDKAIIDGAIECRPIYKNNKQGMKPRDVYFPAFVELIKNLNNQISLKYVSYDRWNSTEQIQQLRSNRILAFKKDICRDDYVRFASSVYSRAIEFPKRENDALDPMTTRNMPCAKAVAELKKLNDDGRVVDHPKQGSSDMIQCYVGVHRLLQHPDLVISEQELKANQRRRGMFGYRRKVGRVIKLPQRGSRR